ncbi:hypothetical protein [Nocardioides kribbensis]|uniref:hypothetical protein n=1 Tax=Nocardioides kribbensis TaxID=305517 RepID=UPI00187AE734|nr:hypothetical protein [Nocardioides kribbensis]
MSADDLEARCRRAMAVLPKARGWDSRRDRDDELTMIDLLLDEYNELARPSDTTNA